MENLDIQKLINEIHKRPSIWDMRSDEYSNKIIKKRSWEEVTEQESYSGGKKNIGSNLQKKWKHIRDRYSRDLKEQKGKSGQARKGKSVYMYANQLAFLTDVMHRRPTETSLDNMDSTSPNQKTDSVPAVLHEPDFHVAKRKNGNLVKRKLLEAIEEHTCRQKQKSQTKKFDSYEDDDKLFLLSLLPLLKSIPPHFKIAARMDIMQSINKFIIIQSPTPHNQPHQHFSQNINQAPGHQTERQYQYLNGSTGVQSYFGQSQSGHQQEPQPGLSGIQQQNSKPAAPLLSPISSVYSQDETEFS